MQKLGLIELCFKINLSASISPKRNALFKRFRLEPAAVGILLQFCCKNVARYSLPLIIASSYYLFGGEIWKQILCFTDIFIDIKILYYLIIIIKNSNKMILCFSM